MTTPSKGEEAGIGLQKPRDLKEGQVVQREELHPRSPMGAFLSRRWVRLHSGPETSQRPEQGLSPEFHQMSGPHISQKAAWGPGQR